MDNTQLAELLIGIAKAQAAVIDAMERAQPGFRNNHVVPTLTTAANVRAATPRIQDLPSRIVLRMQGRTPFDVEQVRQDLEAAMASQGTAPPDDPSRNIPPAAARAAARAAAARPAAPGPAPAAAPAGPSAAPADDLDFSAKA